MTRLHRSLLWLAIVPLLVSCERASESPAGAPEAMPIPPATPLASIRRGGEPLVRVRIETGAEKIRISGPSKVLLSTSEQPRGQLVATPMEFSRSGGQWAGLPFVVPTSSTATVMVSAVSDSAPLRLEKNSYPGALHLVPRSTLPDSPNDVNRFDVVNHLRVEAYLPGVLHRELYDHWDAAAYLAQAIAARTYAIDRVASQGPGRHFDMESTQASQAYSGATSRVLALRAVADTVGLVLTFNDRIITAYYSSTCGGANQSATDAFGVPNVTPPLSPRQTCQWCKGSQHYAWETVTRNRRDLSKRLAAWGKLHQMSIANLGTVASITADAFNPLGRPVRFTVTDERGKAYALRAETFRNACNFGSKELPLKEKNLKSSACSVSVKGETVSFENGRGFGHCVGLCQFGAQGQARAGRSPLEILAEYYPDAKVERAY